MSMIHRAYKGRRMQGLVAYLCTEGTVTSEAHTQPTMVAAGDPALMDQFGHDTGRVLDRDDGLRIGGYLDQARRVHGVSRDKVNVLHVTLNMDPGEGTRTYAQWQAIAEDFMREMGYEGRSGNDSAINWAAFHHGQSRNGNDHVQIAISTVRDDGTKIDRHNDHPRAAKLCRALEHRHGLAPFEQRPERTPTIEPWEYDQAERRFTYEVRSRSQQAMADARAAGQPLTWKQARNDAQRHAREAGLDQPDSQWLAGRVRAAATASTSEAEFVRRVRRSGVLVRPRFAAGGTTEVTGYSVARKAPAGTRTYWKSGGRLGHDLRLPALRTQLDQHSDAAALTQWQAGRANTAVVPSQRQRETLRVSPEKLQQATRDMSSTVAKLANADVHDHALWQQQAREAAGLCAAWAHTLRGDDARAFDQAGRQLARAATATPSVPEHTVTPQRFAAAAVLRVGVAARGGMVGQLTTLQEIVKWVQAISRAREAAGYAHHAHQLATKAAQPLAQVHARWRELQPAQPGWSHRQHQPTHGKPAPQVRPERGIGR